MIHRKFDTFLRRFPLIGKIYKGGKEIVGIIKDNKKNDKQNIIVAIKFDDSYSL